jgi:N-acetylmuramoyl-L-alanine amidase
MKIVMSSGHGKYIRGASGYLDEVNEARRVVDRVAQAMDNIVTFHDDVSHSQSENLDRIIDFHNSQTRDLDVSVHFNAYETTSKPMGTEVWYVTQGDLAADVSEAIADAGDFIDRGSKYTSSLAFLNGTEEPAILIEVCFVDSSADADLYERNFNNICLAIAQTLGGDQPVRPPISRPPSEDAEFYARGKCSHFGGPEDTGVSPSEGLAFIYDFDAAPHLFLPEQPSGTTGLARRLNPNIFYVACRWDYSQTPKEMLATPTMQALVKAKGKQFYAWPADWGPHEDTGRVADLSPGLMVALDLTTDDEVEVTYPAP